MFSKLLLMCCLCFHLTAGYFEQSSSEKDYDSASAYCEKNDGTLASLTEEEAKDFTFAGDVFWVGLKRVSGGWRYDDGTELTADQFAALEEEMRHEPSKYNLRPHEGEWLWSDNETFSFENPMWQGGDIAKWGECGVLTGPGLLNARNCRRIYRFICEYPDVDIENFEVSETTMDYSQATEHCESNNGKLAILTLAQAKQFTSAQDMDELWVGVQRVSGDWKFDNGTMVSEEVFAQLSYHMQAEPAYYNLRPSGGRYEWTDGSVFDITADEMWVGGSPDPLWGTCGALKGPGEITALNCRRSKRFICEY